MATPGRPAHAIRFGDFEADFRAGQLRKHGLRIKLQEQPLQILAMMLERPGEVVTREELRKRLWPEDTFVDFDHGLNNAINRLREALNDSADTPRFIETLPRRGYRFIGEVSSVDLLPIEEASQVTSNDGSTTPRVVAPERPASVTAPLPLPRRQLKRLWLGAAGMGVAAAVILGLHFQRVRS